MLVQMWTHLWITNVAKKFEYLSSIEGVYSIWVVVFLCAAYSPAQISPFVHGGISIDLDIEVHMGCRWMCGWVAGWLPGWLAGLGGWSWVAGRLHWQGAAA